MLGRARANALALLLFASSGACRSQPEPAVPLTAPARLCSTVRAHTACRSSDDVLSWLRDPKLVIVGAADAPDGIQQARVLTLATQHGGRRVIFRAKWRAYSTGTSMSAPRKELAAYHVQALFLEERDYVVPPTAAHCFSTFQYRQLVDEAAQPTFAGTDCVFGVLSYWLENAKPPDAAEHLNIDDALWDAARFARDAAYRRAIANLNLFTYLIHHGDTHENQFLVAGDRRHPLIFSVDNSMAFAGPKNPSLSYDEDWSYLHVPALPRAAVKRLAGVRKKLERLAVLEQFEIRNRALVPAAPAPTEKYAYGYRWTSGELQVGLNQREIIGVAARIDDLVERVRSSQIKLF